MENQTLDIDVVEEGKVLTKASKGKRFANYLIDSLVFYAISIGFWILVFSLGLDIDESSISGLTDRILSMLFFALLYFVFEAGLKGKTVANLLPKQER